jgi:hypothetical protein
MSGEIERDGKWVRPRFNHCTHGATTPQDAAAAQMLESIRNILEDIQRSQMLQCDVRRDIWEIRLALQRKRREPKAKAKRRRP